MADLGRRAHVADAEVNATTQTFALRWCVGGLEALEGRIERLARERPHRPFFRCLLAVVSSERGDREGARATLQLASDDLAAIPMDSEWLPSLALLAEVATALKDDLCAVLHRLLAPHEELVVINPHEFSVGAAGRTLGVLAATLSWFEEAERSFEGALRINERIGARPWLARTQEDFARMLFDA